MSIRPLSNDANFSNALIQAGRTDHAGHVERAAAMIALGKTTGLAAPPVVPGASFLQVVSKVLLLSALVVAPHPQDESKAPASPSAASARACSSSSPPRVVQTADAPDPQPEPHAVVSTASAGPTTITRIAPVRPPTPSPDPLLQEVERLEAARRAIGQRDYATAMALLQANLASRALAPEAELLAIEALLNQGRTTEAEAAVSRFLQKYPLSPLAPRAKELMSSSKPRADEQVSLDP